MQYRNDRYGEPISLLGFGCMRFTRRGGSIIYEKAEREVMEALDSGVNYFDTAYVYPGSEALMGEIFSNNSCRDRINIATKLPHYLMKTTDGAEKLFREELKRLKTDHIDYYLMHMLSDIGSWEKLKKMGIEEWIAGKKASGQIRNIGFSFHGSTDMFSKVLDAYDWDFCQIQYNYMDVNSQAGRAGLAAANKKGLPVIIMEPLRGGRLVQLLPEEAKKLIAENPRGYSPAELALRWIWEQPAVTCVLSGMNSLEMVQENVRIASEVKEFEFTEADHDLIDKVRNIVNANIKVGCIGCNYCQPCPQGVDIPAAFRCYNEMAIEEKSKARHEYLQVTAMRPRPTSASLCIGCGKCEQHCPQHLEIRKELKNAAKALETPSYKMMRMGQKIFRMF